MPGCTFKGATYAAVALWREDSTTEYSPNPKRPNTKSFDRYAEYSTAKSIGEALELGSLPDDILFDFEKGHLKISEPLRQAPLDLSTVSNFDELTYTDKVFAKWVHLASTQAEAGGEHDPNLKLRVAQLDESIRKQKATMKKMRELEKPKILAERAKALDVDVDALDEANAHHETPIMATRRIVANQQAKEMLEVILNEGRTVTDFEVLEVLRLWDFRQNTARQNVMREGETFVYSDTVGLVCDYKGGVVVKHECRRYPDFGRLLNRWLSDHIPKDLGADFVYTSININKNYAGALHRDGNNLGPSFLKSFGEFKGGELNYYPEDDKSCNLEVLQAKHGAESVEVDVSQGLLLFDGKRAHFVNEFEGERYSLVFFTCPRSNRITEEGRAQMEAAGFPFPAQDSIDILANVLRKPKGYEPRREREETAVQENENPSIHDATFLFYPHASPERDDRENHARQYWKAKGVRDRTTATRKQSEDWKIHHMFVLQTKPIRTDLILEKYNNLNDAVLFLNKSDSDVPAAIAESGCCAVYSRKKSAWLALHRPGFKTEALELFNASLEVGKDTTDISSSQKRKVSELDECASAETPHKGTKRTNTYKNVGESTTKNSSQKRKASEHNERASSEKYCRGKEHASGSKTAVGEDAIVDPSSLDQKASECDGTASAVKDNSGGDVAKSFATAPACGKGVSPGTPSFEVGSLVEIKEHITSRNPVNAASLSIGQKGLVVQVDADGHASIHFFDHRKALQWIAPADLGKLSLLPIPPSVAKPTVQVVKQTDKAKQDMQCSAATQNDNKEKEQKKTLQEVQCSRAHDDNKENMAKKAPPEGEFSNAATNHSMVDKVRESPTSILNFFKKSAPKAKDARMITSD